MRKRDEDCRCRCGFSGGLARSLHARQHVPLTVWCLVTFLAAVALGATACTPVAPVSSASSGTSPSQSTASAETKEIEVDLEELAQSLPKEGLPEKYIDETFLGCSDKVERKGSCTFYTWYAKNGSKDEIFYAGCANGAVVVTLKLGYQFGTVYWPDSDGLPNLYAESPSKKESGKAPAKSRGSSDASADGTAGSGSLSSPSSTSKKPNKYSPRDYDFAEDWEADTGGSLEEWDRQ